MQVLTAGGEEFVVGADIPSSNLRHFKMQLLSDGLIKFTDERAHEHVQPLFEMNPTPAFSREPEPEPEREARHGVLPPGQFVTALPAASATNAGIVFNGKRNRDLSSGGDAGAGRLEVDHRSWR